MDNHEIALEQQHGNAGASLRAKEEQELCFDCSTPVGTHFTVRFEGEASFGRVLYEGTKIVGVPFMIATVWKPTENDSAFG